MVRGFIKVLGVVVVSAIISTVGGVGLDHVSEKVFVILPLLVVVPALSGVTGSLGTVIGSKFTTYLFLGVIRKDNVWSSEKFWELVKDVFSVGLLESFLIGVGAYVLVGLRGGFVFSIFIRVVAVSVITCFVLLSVLTLVSVLGGLLIFERNGNPDDYLVPIITSVGDLVNYTVLALLVLVLF